MNGANGETGTSKSGANGEELDGVLGRFEDWAKTRRINPLASYGASAGIGPKPVSQKSKLIAEARELSYEKALKASRFRRLPDFVPVEVAPLPAKSPDVEQLSAATSIPAPVLSRAEALADPQPPVEAKAKVEVAAAPLAAAPLLSASPASTPIDHAAQTELPKILKKAEIPKVLKKDAAALTAARPGRASVSTSPTVLKVADFGKARSRSVGESVAARPAQKAANSLQAARTKATGERSVAVVASPSQPVTAIAPRVAPRKKAAGPSFQEALQASIQRSPELPAAEVGKGSSLTMRISDAEQARIQTRASQAKLSVSAYVRQCALGVDRGLREAHEHRTVSGYLRHCSIGVEDLREQIDLLIQREHPAPPVPGLSAIPGILARFLRQCFRRSPPTGAAVQP